MTMNMNGINTYTALWSHLHTHHRCCSFYHFNYLLPFWLDKVKKKWSTSTENETLSFSHKKVLLNVTNEKNFRLCLQKFNHFVHFIAFIPYSSSIIFSQSRNFSHVNAFFLCHAINFFLLCLCLTFIKYSHTHTKKEEGNEAKYNLHTLAWW